MNRKLDVAEMEAAFKRAAHKALHGTREERAGRFLRDEKRPRQPGPRRHGRTDRAKEKAGSE